MESKDEALMASRSLLSIAEGGKTGVEVEDDYVKNNDDMQVVGNDVEQTMGNGRVASNDD